MAHWSPPAAQRAGGEQWHRGGEVHAVGAVVGVQGLWLRARRHAGGHGHPGGYAHGAHPAA